MMKLAIVSLLTLVNAAHLFMEQFNNHSLGTRLTLMVGYFNTNNQHFPEIYPQFRRFLENSASDPTLGRTFRRYLRLDDKCQEVRRLVSKYRGGKAFLVHLGSLSYGCLQYLEMHKYSDPNLETLCECIARYDPKIFSTPSAKSTQSAQNTQSAKSDQNTQNAQSQSSDQSDDSKGKDASWEESVLLNRENIWVNSLEFNFVCWKLQMSILEGYIRALSDDEEIVAKFTRLVKEYKRLEAPQRMLEVFTSSSSSESSSDEPPKKEKKIEPAKNAKSLPTSNTLPKSPQQNATSSQRQPQTNSTSNLQKAPQMNSTPNMQKAAQTNSTPNMQKAAQTNSTPNLQKARQTVPTSNLQKASQANNTNLQKAPETITKATPSISNTNTIPKSNTKVINTTAKYLDPKTKLPTKVIIFYSILLLLMVYVSGKLLKKL